MSDQEHLPPVQESPDGIIVSIRVKNLFGKYSYLIDLAEAGSPVPRGRQIGLLYGDNGAGKTTILQLVWHLLSSARNKGHRTFLRSAPFEALHVTLNSGDVISAVKLQGDIEAFHIRVTNAGRLIAEERYPTSTTPRIRARVLNEISRLKEEGQYFSAVELERRISRGHTEDRYADYLSRIGLVPHLLADDRQIYGDDIHELSDDYDERLAALTLLREREAKDTHGVLARELESAMKRISAMIQQLALSGNTTGSQNSNNIYLDLVQRISSQNADDEPDLRDALIKRIFDLGTRTAAFSEFGLAPRLDAKPFSEALTKTPYNLVPAVADTLVPYLDMQSARLDALQSVETILRTLVDQINGFFYDKHASYNLRSGLTIESEGGPLTPSQLSSGERQILLLLLNTVLARQGTGLFLIDEPEISLNVKWQRRLTDALVACAKESRVQFIIATHSVEIITGNANRLVHLRPEISKAK
jgi:predicted ATPase